MPRALAPALVLAMTLTAACATSAPPALAADATPSYRLELVTGGLYRFVAGHYRSVVLVTDESVVLTDPIDAQAARWLRAEVARRFDKPVRWVLYSHDHPDHAYGGEAFDGPGVTFVAHRLARDSWVRTRARVRLPDLVFEDEITLDVDGHPITLRYHGTNNGRGNVSMLFVNERVLHVVDWIVVGRLPYRALPGYDLGGMIASTRQALTLDLDRFVGGHAAVGDRGDVKRALAYVEALHDGVLEGMLAGHPLERIQRELDLAAFSDLAMYDEWRAENIAGAYAQLRDQAYVLRRPEIPGQ